MTVTDELFVPLWHADPAAPRITHYDDADGSRVELSAATLANWAAKTANWLRDGLGVVPGDRVAVRLPAHWQTVGVVLGVWWAGAVVSDVADGAVLAVHGPEGAADLARADEVAAVSLDPLGVGVRNPPDGVLDYVGEVRVHADTFRPEPLPGSAPATDDASVEGVAAAARRTAAELEITKADRVLSTLPWSGAGLVTGLLSVLAGGASLVQCTHPAAAALETRAAAERVTATLGVTISGYRCADPA